MQLEGYLECSDKALYFAGPQIEKLLAVSAEDGRILWENSYGNFQLILRDDGLYGLSGNWMNRVSKKFDPLTGRVLADLPIARRSCTRPTGAIDGIFYRAGTGSVRFDPTTNRQNWISPMRPDCHDGVTIANGMLYWWPWACDCALTLLGVTCLGPAGDFVFSTDATEDERLEKGTTEPSTVASLPESPADWPTFRANNQCSVTTEAVAPKTTVRLWEYKPKLPTLVANLTAPVAAGGLVLSSGSDGVVRALDAATGKLEWKAYTGGAIRFPPTIWKGRALVGSGDGWVYSFEAKTGRLLWRFRAAPVERKIPVYGALLSTWPAASGVLVEDGIAYVAAGIVNYDGTHVYALDAATGKLEWHNGTSGHLDPDARTGVSVQGHLLLHDSKLYMAGGTSISPAAYDITDGKCLNDPEILNRVFHTQASIYKTVCPRGWELFLFGNTIKIAGRPFYVNPKNPVYDRRVTHKMLATSTGDRSVAWANNQKVMCFARGGPDMSEQILAGWGKVDIPGLEPIWEFDCDRSVALALCRNAVVIAKESQIVAVDLEDGSTLWTQPLPSPPVDWGLAVDRDGRMVVTLEDGRILCFAGGA